jgi:energy-coupling factor transporter ATP-binding protein EcfA2
MELLGAMGMADKAGRRPNQLSGGEQQRVAIAVALANNPEVIFADEPTGELDSATGDDVFEALRAANRDLGATVVVVTHDHAVSSQVQRTVAIRDGRTATEVVRRTHVDEEGVTQTIHEEYAVLDRAGRLQLPRDYRSSLGLRDRVRLELEDDHIGVWPDGSVRKVRHAAPAVEVATEGAQPTPEPSLPVSPYLARPIVESPSKPPAPATGQIPVVERPAAAEAEPEPQPDAQRAPASPYAALATLGHDLDRSLEEVQSYTPRVAAPPSPPADDDDPYAPPVTKENDDD